MSFQEIILLLTFIGSCIYATVSLTLKVLEFLLKRAADLDRSQRQMKALHKAAIIMKIALRFRKAIFGAPCGSKPEHFCVSGRHRHHTAAHPEVMPVVPPREDKRGMLKYQGAFAAYPRSTNWAAVFHSPLDISPSLFFRLIAEQPTSPYPGGITESKSKHGTCLVQ